MILHLDIPTFKTVGDAPLNPSVFTFAHNSSILTACAILRDGYIRPSAFAKHQAQWLPVPGFYSRGSMSNSDREEDVSRSLEETFRKAMPYSHFSDATRPISILELHIRDSINTVPYMREEFVRIMPQVYFGMLAIMLLIGAGMGWIFRSQLAQVKGIAVYV